MISLESCGSGTKSDSACCHTQMYGGSPTLLMAVRETGPWEDDAYFITKGSTLSVKRAELHCAVIGNQLQQCLSRFEAFWPTALRFFFFFFLSLCFYPSDFDCDTSECLGTWEIFTTEDEGQAASSVNCSFSDIKKKSRLFQRQNKAQEKLQQKANWVSIIFIVFWQLVWTQMLCTASKWNFLAFYSCNKIIPVKGGFYMCCSKQPVSFRQRALHACCIGNLQQHH